LYPTENERGRACNEIKQRCNYIEGQQVFYCDIKLWARKEYVTCCSRKDRSGISWFKADVWKLRGTMNELDNGRCPLRNEEEDAVHILLKCPETRRLREHLLGMKWLTINEEIAYKKIISCTNTLEIRNTGSYLYKFKRKWENRIKKLQLDIEYNHRTK
jgi:hypothetical protein